MSDALTGLLMYRDLQASEQKFRSLAENMPDTLIRYDREGRRTYINPALKRISAVRDEQMIGLTQQESNPFIMPEIYRLALDVAIDVVERLAAAGQDLSGKSLAADHPVRGGQVAGKPGEDGGSPQKRGQTAGDDRSRRPFD